MHVKNFGPEIPCIREEFQLLMRHNCSFNEIQPDQQGKKCVFGVGMTDPIRRQGLFLFWKKIKLRNKNDFIEFFYFWNWVWSLH